MCVWGGGAGGFCRILTVKNVTDYQSWAKSRGMGRIHSSFGPGAGEKAAVA